MNKITRRSFLYATGGMVASMTAPTTFSQIAPPTTNPTTRPTTRPKGNARDNYLKVRPTEFKDNLLNPHIGTQTFQRFNGDPITTNNRWDDAHGPVVFPGFDGNLKNDHYPDTTVAYCRWVWAVMEPEKEKYRWDIIDSALKSALDRRQTLHVRLQPFVTPAPQWYFDLGGTKRGRGLDDNNPLYLENFGRLIREFGKRYDGHPNLEAFDIAYAGIFGEMGGTASPQTAQKLTDIYLEALPKTPLISMMGTLGGDYALTLKRPIGFRFDCFGDSRVRGGLVPPKSLDYNEMYDDYPRQTEHALEIEQWKIAPIVLETCGTVGTWYPQGDIDWIIEQGYQFHASMFMPKSCAYPDEWHDKMQAFNNRLGYRFVLRQFDFAQHVSAGASVGTSIFMENVGIAPIYRPYKLALRFSQGAISSTIPLQVDLRKWLPGNHYFEERVTIPRELKVGSARLDMAIIDDAGDPKVKLAIEGIGLDSWYPMGAIDIMQPG